MKRALIICVLLAVLAVGCASVKGTSTPTPEITVVQPSVEALKASMILQTNGVMGKGFIDHEEGILYTAWFDPRIDGPMQFMGLNGKTMRVVVFRETPDRSGLMYFAGPIRDATLNGPDISLGIEVIMEGWWSRDKLEKEFVGAIGALILCETSALDVIPGFYHKYLLLQNAT